MWMSLPHYVNGSPGESYYASDCRLSEKILERIAGPSFMYVFMYDCPARRVDAELRTAMRESICSDGDPMCFICHECAV